MSFLQNLTFSQLLWLVPVLFAIHNLEEVPQMERWSKRIPSHYSQPVTTRQFSLAVTLLTLLVLVVTILAVNYPANRLFYLLVFEFQVIILLNVFVPHVLTTVRFKMYSPGLVSGIVLSLPFSIFFSLGLGGKIPIRTRFIGDVFAGPAADDPSYPDFSLAGKCAYKASHPEAGITIRGR